MKSSIDCDGLRLIFFLLLFSYIPNVQSMDWSKTEVHFQHGDLKQVGTDGGESETLILTLQHADGWAFGDNFFFIDYSVSNSDQHGKNPFNPGYDDKAFYGEGYSNFSLSKLTDRNFAYGFIKDVGILVGINVAPEVDSWWFLPGIRLSLDLPGFNFANLSMTGYLNHAYGDKHSNQFVIVDESDSWMVDFSWSYPFKLGVTSWSLEGHIEYIAGRHQENNFGEKNLAGWILAQPQLRLDAGELLFDSRDRLFVGIEYQYWHNKLGEDGTHDQEAQLLMVLRF